MLIHFFSLGKSTLIAAFYNRKFVDNYQPTIFETFTVSTEIYKKHVNLEICDSAGKLMIFKIIKSFLI